jgi:hypothetical protein
LEGAVTTREVAKEMIRSGRKPRDNSEQMILNNYVTMQRIRTLKASALSPSLVFQIHRLVTENTLDDPTAAGRFRRADEKRVVGDDYGEVYHDPPPAEELEERMAAMCAFANGETPGYLCILRCGRSSCTSGWPTIIPLWMATGAPRGHCFTGPCCTAATGFSSSSRSPTSCAKLR